MSKASNASKTKNTAVVDFDPTSVKLDSLEKPDLDVIIETCRAWLEDEKSESPIIDVSTSSYAQKAPSGKNNGKSAGKIFETRCAFRGCDGTLYQLGGRGSDKDIGPAGIQGGVKHPKFREFGLTIMFKTKTNKKMGEALNLLCKVLHTDAVAKLKRGEIKSKNKSVTNPVKDELGSDKSDAQTKKDYNEAGDYMVRARIQIKGPFKTCVYEETIVDKRLGPDDDELPNGGGFLHAERQDLTEANAHEIFTIGMGMEYFEFGITRKAHGFGVSFNLYMDVVYPIPRDVSMDRPAPKTGRSTADRLKFAEKATERIAQKKANDESIRRRAEKNNDDNGNNDEGDSGSDNEEERAPKRKTKKDKTKKKKRTKAPTPSASEGEQSENEDGVSESE
jgi:hypothetical protein